MTDKSEYTSRPDPEVLDKMLRSIQEHILNGVWKFSDREHVERARHEEGGLEIFFKSGRRFKLHLTAGDEDDRRVDTLETELAWAKNEIKRLHGEPPLPPNPICPSCGQGCGVRRCKPRVPDVCCNDCPEVRYAQA